MQDLIHVVNKVQDIFLTLAIPMSLDLPRIAVVGAQSSGKSSVLESVVGCDFLPRGAGMVTRCPVILQLQHIREGPAYAVFNHKNDMMYHDFEEVRKEIVEQTNKLTKNPKDVTNTPIILKVFSTSVLNLTLVDLPGLIRVPDKDQPANIGEIIRDVVLNEIKGENCVILAVSAGNVDMANSDALNLARFADPTGSRTLGVITKLDIMDKGTDAMEVLTGKTYPLKLGYVGVVCRSPNDLKTRKSLSEAVECERTFFEKTPAYASIKTRSGIPFLGKRLSSLLLEHVRKCIPELKATVAEKLKVCKTELKSYGVEYQGNVHAILNATISAFVEYYQSAFDGTTGTGKELNQGARVHYILHNAFTEELKTFGALDGLTDDYIRTTVANASALRFCSLIPDAAFEKLIKQQIRKLQDSSLKCLDLVYEEIMKILKSPTVPQLRSFSLLGNRIISITEGFLNDCLDSTREHICDLVETECTYINSEDPSMDSFEDIMFEMFRDEMESYIGKLAAEKQRDPKAAVLSSTEAIRQAFAHVMGKAQRKMTPAVVPAMGRAASGPVSLFQVPQDAGSVPAVAPKISHERRTGLELPLPKVMTAEFAVTKKEDIKLRAMKKFLESYFETVKAKLSDTVPKTIMTFFVDRSRTMAITKLSEILHGTNDMKELMAEDPDVVLRRADCKKHISALEESQHALSNI